MTSLPAVARKRERGIDRVIAVLQGLLSQRSPIAVGQLAQLIGAPRSSTYEIVNRLIEAEIVEPVGRDGFIHFGRAARLIGLAYAEINPLHRRASAVLDRLAADTGETAQICMLRGNKHVIMDARNGSALFRLSAAVGVDIPLPWTASGRLFASHLTPQEVLGFIPPEDFCLSDGSELPVDAFLNDVAAASKQGYCCTTGLIDGYSACIAAPVRNEGGAVQATLCLVVPVDTDKERTAALVERLLTDAASLSDDLHGY